MKKVLTLFTILSLISTSCSSEKSFAKCLNTAGASLYGAFYCEACQTQKSMFADGKSELPYIECSKDSPSSEYELCIEQKIYRYPTWTFENGNRLEGVQSLETLSKETSCKLPK
ncbi:hypothetical protein KKC94_00830 [Patescibacteria group bacterium]|nr:hypothetical protein [Patescibacteria group bacterium]